MAHTGITAHLDPDGNVTFTRGGEPVEPPDFVLEGVERSVAFDGDELRPATQNMDDGTRTVLSKIDVDGLHSSLSGRGAPAPQSISRWRR